MNSIKKSFTRNLLQWNRKLNHRAMPWKGEKDPYRIWLSEIILQQTRVEQGMEYYKNFVRHFPTVQQLAAAKKETVFKLWEGLGYYQRCKNLHATAGEIVRQHGGIFPNTYEGLLALKGIGPYTAAAIASFAWNAPHAVVDGNVFRVLSRYFGSFTPIDSTAGKKEYGALAQELLPPKKAAEYNQAIMDFGATVCKPRNPLCTSCVLRSNCAAHTQHSIHLLPVKEKKTGVKKRWFFYLVAEQAGKIYLFKRTGNDIWENLYEFWLTETDSAVAVTDALVKKWLAPLGKKISFRLASVSTPFSQRLTHRQIEAVFIELHITGTVQHPGAIAVPRAQLVNYAFPKVVREYLELP